MVIDVDLLFASVSPAAEMRPLRYCLHFFYFVTFAKT
jgi:hypothetical protein